MRYPKFLRPNDIIGITAPSAGAGHKLAALDLSIKQMEQQGYQVVETANVRVNGGVSGPAKERAEQLVSLFFDDTIAMVMCATGGDFMMEILPYIDFDAILANPKWVMGASDPSSLLYCITTKLDIATMYGLNAGGYDQIHLHPALQNNFALIKGEQLIQQNFPTWGLEKDEDNWKYQLTDSVAWQLLRGEFTANGRLIGGCIDVLQGLLGTPWDTTKAFVERYQTDGFIWYFDVYSLSSEDFYRTLFQMKYAGWFASAKAVVVGRVRFPSGYSEMTYQTALMAIFPDIPLVFDADIGHTYPALTLINGALATLSCTNKKQTLEMEYK